MGCRAAGACRPPRHAWAGSGVRNRVTASRGGCGPARPLRSGVGGRGVPLGAGPHPAARGSRPAGGAGSPGARPRAVGVLGKGCVGGFQLSGTALGNPSGSAWDGRLLWVPCLGLRWGTPPGSPLGPLPGSEMVDTFRVPCLGLRWGTLPWSPLGSLPGVETGDTSRVPSLVGRFVEDCPWPSSSSRASHHLWELRRALWKRRMEVWGMGGGLLPLGQTGPGGAWLAGGATGQMGGHPFGEVSLSPAQSWDSLCTGMVPSAQTHPAGGGPGRTPRSPLARVGAVLLLSHRHGFRKYCL